MDPIKSFSILGQELKIIQEDKTWKLQDESSLKYVPGAAIGFEAGEGDLKLGAIKVGITKANFFFCFLIEFLGSDKVCA